MQKKATQIFPKTNASNEQILGVVLIIFRGKDFKQKIQATAKHKCHKNLHTEHEIVIRFPRTYKLLHRTSNWRYCTTADRKPTIDQITTTPQNSIKLEYLEIGTSA